ncbi:MAG: hypothetical protein WEB59_04070 [Thermoanaerobaculia bacterium]
MSGPAFFEETQRFSPWVYVLLCVVLAILLGVLTMRQTTTVSGDTVTVRFGRLYTTRIPVAEVAKAQAVAYRPVRDYGGWGIKGSRRRRALNTRSDRGVLLTKTDGSTILIGSQKPRELLAALERAGVRTEDRLPVETRDF